MKVAMYYNNHDIRLQEMPVPDIGDKEILLKVMSSGICGSDVMEWYRIKKAPLVLGHEVAGVVHKTGKKVKSFKKGDRIFVTHHVPCDSCSYCKGGNETACHTLKTTNFHPGGFSQYIRVPEINVRKGTLELPKGMTFDEGTFVEPVACVVRGQRVANVRKGNVVAVLGSGMTGLLHIQLAKAKGAVVIATDVSEYRLKMAKKMGADYVIDAREDVPAKIKELAGKLADRVIVSTGAMPAIKQAFSCLDAGGTILFFAPTDPGAEVAMPFNDIWFKSASIVTTYAAARSDLTEAIKLIKTKKIRVKPMVTHRLPLAQTQKGFGLVMSGAASVKVIIEPHK
ncbi:MAG: zinc-binding dehydrogenase [Candidatus Aenigmatarchaeota archaeon]